MGRPDMAIWKFTESIINNKAIEVFNKGNLSRDFTYVDDIIDGVQKAIILSKNKKFSKHRIYNLGNNSPVVLNTMIKLLEDTIGKKAKKKLVSMQPGDVKKTFADIEKSRKELNFKPKTSLRQGLLKFVNWYKEYHKI
jgi:UDP-glucuronate 4-epimerase